MKHETLTIWNAEDFTRPEKLAALRVGDEVAFQLKNGKDAAFVVADIADGLGVTTATVYRELKRGETGGLDRNLRKAYNPVLAQQRVQENFKRRGKSAVNS